MPIISTLRWALAESANHDFPYERIAEGLAADEVDSGMPYRDLSLAKNRTFVKNDAGHIDYLQGYLLRHIHEDRLIGRIQAHAFLDGLDAGWRIRLIRFIRVLRIYGVYRGDRCFRIRGRRGCSGNNLHLYLATNRLIIRIGRRKGNLLLTGGRSRCFRIAPSECSGYDTRVTAL